MTIALATSSTTDRKLVSALNAVATKDAEYWGFKQQSDRLGVHDLMQYPAMMVPKMQGVLLDTLLSANPGIRHVCDPFVGAGTTLVECMGRGLDFTGFDINPLAILLCRAKSERLSSIAFNEKSCETIDRCRRDKGKSLEVSFPGRDKWFQRRTAIELARIRRAIAAEPARWARQLMWAALAETIRRTSNARTSTYKLHIRPAEQLDTLPSAIEVFAAEIHKTGTCVTFQEQYLQGKNLLRSGGYVRTVSLQCQDIRSIAGADRLYDLILTSPPYGDNRSTVAYGQFSYLALNWIPAVDLPGANELRSSAYMIDTNSLGGRSAGAARKATVLLALSREYAKYHQQLKKLKRKDLEAKVASFLYDFFDALTVVVSRSKSGAYLAWTLGDRTVGGISVPFTSICQEMQEHLNLSHVTTVKRQIPSKRTPIRNSIGSTMGAECLLIMRKT